MEVTDEILSRNDDTLFYAIVNGEKLERTIKTRRGNFTIKYPTQRDLQKIDLMVARMRNGLAAESFDTNATVGMIKIATLTVCVTSTPDWFRKAQENNENFGWEDMPDVDLSDEIYVKAWTFRQAVKSQIGRIEKDSNIPTVKSENVQETLDNGVFSGVSGKAERKQ